MEKWNSRQRPSFTGDHRSRMNSWTFPADLFFLFCIPNERPTGREGGVNACHFLSTALWEVMMRCRTDSLTIPIISFYWNGKKTVVRRHQVSSNGSVWCFTVIVPSELFWNFGISLLGGRMKRFIVTAVLELKREGSAESGQRATDRCYNEGPIRPIDWNATHCLDLFGNLWTHFGYPPFFRRNVRNVWISLKWRPMRIAIYRPVEQLGVTRRPVYFLIKKTKPSIKARDNLWLCCRVHDLK